MTFSEMMQQNRSCRNYDETAAVTRAQLTQLVALARLAPSSVNRQPLKYYLSCEAETNRRIQPLTHWAGLLKNDSFPRAGHCPTAFIVILHDTRISENISAFQKDVGIVALTMQLGAVEMGLNGCMIGSFDADKLAEALKIPAYLVPQLVLALGQRAEEIVLTEAAAGEVCYFRDGEDRQIVPKRPLRELIINP